jgi:O-antigen ligase
MPVLFFITYATVGDKKTIWLFITAMCLSMVLMDYYTVQQVLWYRNIESRVKIHGTFVYLGPNEVAAFYNQYTILLMSIFLHMKRGLKKLGLAALILTNLFVVVFLFSRAAYLALAMGMFFLFWMKKKVLLIPLILVAVFWQTALPSKVIERIEMTTGDYNELDSSSENRLIAWQESLDLFEKSPIFGVGYGVYRRAGFILGDTHNVYFKILAEQGLIGIMIFLSLLFCLFMRGISLYRYGDDALSKGLGLGFAMAVIVLSVNNFFGDRWTYMEISAYLWIFAALVTKLHILALENTQTKAAFNNRAKLRNSDGKHIR